MARSVMFGLFKSKKTRRHEAWVRRNAELLRARMRDLSGVLRTHGGGAGIEGGFESDFFAGYLSGFAEALLTEVEKDGGKRARLPEMFFDATMKEGAAFVQGRSQRNGNEKRSEFAEGVEAGRDDCRACMATKKAKFLKLGSFLIHQMRHAA